MTPIHFLTTGGTIDKDYATTKGTYDFSIGSPAVERILDKLPENSFKYTLTEVFQIDSLDMGKIHRQQLAEACESTQNGPIIITHGTDSIIKTATHLNEKFPTKTIILTGASQPERFKNSDADLNLGTALGAAEALPHGTYIAIHGQIHTPQSVHKDNDGQFRTLTQNSNE